MNELFLIMAVAIADLDSNSFHVRQKAEETLRKCGGLAVAHIENAQKTGSPEVRYRAKRLRLGITRYYPEPLPAPAEESEIDGALNWMK